MPTKVLFVLDNIREETLLKIKKQLQLNDQVDILVLGIPISTVKRLLSNPLITFLEFNKLEYQEMKEAAINFYVTLPWLIHSHRDFLNVYGEDYWLMPHTEKTIWASRLCHQFYYKLQLDKCRLSSYQEVIYLTDIFSSQNNKWNRLNFFKSMLVETIKFLYRYLLINVFFKLKKHNFIKKENLLITFYPEWFQFKGDGKINDMFFSDLISPQNDQSSWGVLFLSYPLKSLYSFLKKDYHFISRSDYIFIEKYSSLVDIFKLWNVSFIIKNFKTLNKILSWKNEFSFSSIDVTDLVRQDLLRSFHNGSFFGNILWKESFKKFPVENFKRCFYRMEFQPFEYSFLFPLKNKSLFVGFQHSIYGPVFLNYIFPPGVFKGNDLYPLPLPHKIIATGNKIKHELITAGVDPEIFSMVGMVRFNKIFSFSKNKRNFYREELKLMPDDFMVFMPVSQILSENLIMIEELTWALTETPEKYQEKYHFYLKINPNKKNDHHFLTKIEEAFLKIKEKNEVTIFIEDARFYEFIIAADSLYLSGGSASVEALLLGTPSVIFSSANILSHNPMDAYKKTFLMVENEKEIKEAFNQIKNKTFEVDLLEKNKLLDDMFANITTEGRKAFENIIVRRV